MTIFHRGVLDFAADYPDGIWYNEYPIAHLCSSLSTILEQMTKCIINTYICDCIMILFLILILKIDTGDKINKN